MQIAILVVVIGSLGGIGFAIWFLLREAKVAKAREEQRRVQMAALHQKLDGVEVLFKSFESHFDKFAETFGDLVGDARERDDFMKEATDRLIVLAAGFRAMFGILAGRLAVLSGKDGDRIPKWFDYDSDLGKALSIEDEASSEHIEFTYGKDGVVSRTYRNGKLMCEVVHGEFGGVREGTMFDDDGQPLRRFVYDGMEHLEN